MHVRSPTRWRQPIGRSRRATSWRHWHLIQGRFWEGCRILCILREAEKRCWIWRVLTNNAAWINMKRKPSVLPVFKWSLSSGLDNKKKKEMRKEKIASIAVADWLSAWLPDSHAEKRHGHKTNHIVWWLANVSSCGTLTADYYFNIPKILFHRMFALPCFNILFICSDLETWRSRFDQCARQRLLPTRTEESKQQQSVILGHEIAAIWILSTCQIIVLKVLKWK